MLDTGTSSSCDKLSSISISPLMPSSSLIEFIDTALSCTSDFALSYSDSKQKWLIRKHLLSLIQDYPTFTLSTDTFFHDDGTTVNLLQATGHLHVANHTPSIPLTIWIHENYPLMPPMVYVLSYSTSSIHQDHPFVHSSGATSSPYLQTWEFPRCNLTELVHNLVRIFSRDHPFVYSPAASFTHPSLTSKMEALDRLSGMLHYDTIVLLAQTGDEMEDLYNLQPEMVKRNDIVASMIVELEHERMNLTHKVKNLMNQADVLVNWLRVNDAKSHGKKLEDDDIAFVAGDEDSRLLIESLATDRAIEDSMYALDKAVEQGVVSFDAYLKQVRMLAREQFFLRAKLVKLRDPLAFSIGLERD
ncbi:protein ELC [Salix suchowensis]|nr:protein ELC [Salix suchowensis]